jgi:HEAT repeat protein
MILSRCLKNSYKGKIKMLETNYQYQPQVLERSLIYEVKQDTELQRLFSQLSADKPWGERKAAATELGYMKKLEAVPHLIAALPSDPFWMVRYVIIWALENIGDSGAIPTLQSVAENDDFKVIRYSAAKAINRLS